MEKYPGNKKDSYRYHYDGFDYRQDNMKLLQSVQYRCSKSNCKGRAKHSVDDPTKITVSIHNHARDSTPFLTYRMRQKLKERAKNDLSVPLADIFREVSREFADVADQVDPQVERRTMRRIRRKNTPKIPDSYSELGDLLMNDDNIRMLFGYSDALPGQEEKEKFFQKKIDGRDGVSLVFASRYMLDMCLRETSKMKLDATYSSLPIKPKGRHFLTIHAIHGIYAFPVIYVLMESRTKASYVELFSYIKDELLPGWAPEQCMSDFEKPLRSALKECYPMCNLIGCYFHYTQAVQHNWSSHGMMKVPKRLKEEAKLLKNSLMSLPFGRPEDIPGIFELIDDDISLALRTKVDTFIKYFKRTWLSQNNRNYKPEDYSVYGHADRTNNHLESFHSRLHEVHPNIWVFLNLIISINIESRLNFGRFKNGLEITARIPLKVLWTEARVVRARALFEAGRIDARQFVCWCRTTIKTTLAVVRQGRRLKRLLRAERAELQYDDVVTSSDSSIASSYDYEFEPNPHRLDETEREDREAEAEWRNVLIEGDADEDILSENSEVSRPSDNISDASMPSNNDSLWNLPEDEDLQLLHASQFLDEPVVVPIVPVRENEMQPQARPPRACIVCMNEVATYAVVPCGHSLLCPTCKDSHMNDTCDRCGGHIQSMVNVIAT